MMLPEISFTECLISLAQSAIVGAAGMLLSNLAVHYYLDRTDSAVKLLKERWMSVLLHLFSIGLLIMLGLKIPVILR